jgi:hypothetical protein
LIQSVGLVNGSRVPRVSRVIGVNALIQVTVRNIRLPTDRANICIDVVRIVLLSRQVVLVGVIMVSSILSPNMHLIDRAL